MRVIEGGLVVPVVYSAHHASHNFGEFDERTALNLEQKVRFSDYGTDASVPLNGLATIIAERSRALGDLNRDPDDLGRFQTQDYARPERHDIWQPGQALSDEDKQYCQENFYTPYHAKIEELLASRQALTFVVAWDNTAHYQIGENEAGQEVTMKPFILSNRGREEAMAALDGEESSCDPAFMEILADKFKTELSRRNLPNEVHLNLVFKGGYIARRYSTLRNGNELRKLGITAEVQSLQLEYDTALTHDQETLSFNSVNADRIKKAFSTAIEQAYGDYTKAKA